MDNWVPAHRAADGPNGPYTNELLQALRHSVSICARRGVHDLRRVSLFHPRTDLAEPHVLDDRHD